MNENEVVEQQESAESQEQSQAEPTAQVQSKDSAKEENIRALREKANRADELERTLYEIQRRAKMLEEQERQVARPSEPENDPNDDDLLEGKHYKKLTKKYKALEEKFEESTRRNYEMSIEAQVKSQYSDFDDVVNTDTIRALREADADLAASLHANPDTRSKAIATYKAVKRLGLMPTNEHNPDKELAQKNSTKPKSLASISPQQGESPLSRANAFANGLTPELKKQLLKEMEEARKGY